MTMATDEFFLRSDLPMSAAHQMYAEKLIQQLKERDEMILDFDALQSSVDPMLDTSLLPSNGDNDQQFDYEQFLQSYFNTNATDILPSMRVFKLRGFARAGPKFPLLEGIRQLSAITELDLSLNNLSKEGLQFWSLVELKTLKLDNTHLNPIPPSIGRLRKLEHLSLSKNNLNSLPLTLGFCTNLTYLNLQNNRFRTLPGVLLKLTNLQDLKRWDNSLVKRFDGYEPWPHIQIERITHNPSNNLDSLQALVCRTIMATHIDYWAEEKMSPLHCKMLDSHATQYQYCENCHQAACATMFEIKILLLKFVGLTDVPISVFSCEGCKDTLVSKYVSIQAKIRDDMEADYERERREAERALQRELKSQVLSQSSERHRALESRRGSLRRRRQTRKCSIM